MLQENDLDTDKEQICSEYNMDAAAKSYSSVLLYL